MCNSVNPPETDFWGCFEYLLGTTPQKVVLSEGPVETEITVAQLNERSARVYRYLKSRGIGKEDMVMILLPRGTSLVVALLGVWKAGAAAVMQESHEPSERTAFIQKDCGCKLILDEGVWEETGHCEPLWGHEPFDPHAAAFATYTSGTTGNPKGVLHEYGRLPLTCASNHWEGKPICLPDDVYALYYPLNVVAAIMIMSISLVRGMELLIVPLSIARNPREFMDFIVKYRASISFFPPSLFRAMKSFGPYLKRVIISSESADGIWRDPEEMMIWNGYCSSETANAITVSLLDRPNEVAPIGRPQYDVGVYILHEDGSPAAPGEVGELCFDAPYTRGYINLPELNKKAFVDGVFHSGDLARQGADGQYQLVGRMADTVKINGKRVEPTEVENVIKRVTGLRWTSVRGFTDGIGAFLCAYHLGDADFDLPELQERLKPILPYYMLPSYLIPISAIPRNANGKLDRKALPRPSAEDYRSKYVPPENETERLLCEAMQTVLRMEKIGIHDDFFLLGGDSLLSMSLLVESGLPGLRIEDIYQGRTCAMISQHYIQRRRSVEPETVTEGALQRSFPLTVEQRYLVNYERSAPRTTMYNIPILVRIENVSADELAAALRKTIQNHPVLLTELFWENDELMQRYVPEHMPEIVPKRLSEEEWKALPSTIVKPFHPLTNRLLWRAGVYDTDSGTCLFFDVHHLMFDGESYELFISDLQRCLSGGPLHRDHYYDMLARQEAERESVHYLEAKRYFERRYGSVDWAHNLTHDFEGRDNIAGDTQMNLPFTDREYEAAEQATGLGRNGLFVVAGLLALSVMKQAQQVMITWIYNARKDFESVNSAGLLYCTLPAALTLTENMTMAEVYAEIREQTEHCVQYSLYPYISTTYTVPVEDDCICILLQHGIRRLSDEYPMELMELDVPGRASQTSVDVEIRGETLYLDYAANLYQSTTVERYGALIRTIVGKIIENRGGGNLPVQTFLEGIDSDAVTDTESSQQNSKGKPRKIAE